MTWKINFLMFQYTYVYYKSINEPWRAILTCFSPFIHMLMIVKKYFRSFFFSFWLLFLYIYNLFFSLELTRRSFSSAHHILGSLSFFILNNNNYSIEPKQNSTDRFVLFFFLILQLFYIVLHRIESFYFLKEYNKTTLNIHKSSF